MRYKINTAEIEQMSASQREEVEHALAAVEALHEDNPLLDYEPYDKQIRFHKSGARIKAFYGGNRAGKTTAGIADDLIQAVDADCLPNHLRSFKRWEPPFHARIISPDFTATMEGVIFTKLREMVPKSQLVGGSWSKAYDKQQRMLRFENGSWFQFLTSEQDIDKFGGAALHRVHFDEEPPGEKGRAIFQECRMRLIDHGGDVVFTMTPLFGLSWVFDEVWEKRGPERDLKGVYSDETTIQVVASIFDNPHVEKAEIEEALEGLTAAEREARAEGRFVHFAGLVYEEFDVSKHVVGPPTRQHLEGMTIFVGIDPGIQVTAINFCAFDQENHLLVFDELQLTGPSAIPENATKAIRQLEAKWQIQPQYYIIDPAARHRELVNAEQVAGAYLRAGIVTVPGQNAVEAGIFEVKRRLEHGQLLVSDNCQKLLWEFGRYRLDPKADSGFGVVKRDDHGLDALRYVAMARPVAPRTLPRERTTQRSWHPNQAPPYFDSPPTDTHPFGSDF